MLTMTVMQHEGGAAGQFSTEPAEAEDVLSRLRHLHRTLQECHWRVQVVDHALCAQGDRGHRGLQNQTENDHSFEIQARKDCSFQNQAKENYSLQHEFKKDCDSQSKTGKDQDLEEQFTEVFYSKEHLEDDGLQNQPREDQNCQNGGREESGNQFCGDYHHKKLAEEKHSFLDTTTRDQKHSQQTEDNIIQDPNSDTKENLLDCTTGDCSLSDLATNDHIVYNYAKKDNYIPNETKEECDMRSSIKDPCGLDGSDSLKKRKKYLTKQESVDMDDGDPLLINTIDFLSADSSDPGVDEILPVSGTITDIKEQNLTHTSLNAEFSEKVLKQEDSQKRHYVGEVRYRPDSIRHLEKEVCYEGHTELYENEKKDNTSQDHQQKSKEIGCVKYIDKLSTVHASSEVAQRMDVIWDALENLRSHFFALHSSLVDSSDLFCSQESGKSSDDSLTTTKENDSISKCGNKLHTLPEDVPSETTQIHQAPCEQPLQRKPPVENYSHCVCQNLSGHKISSHTLQHTPADSAALSDTLTHRRAYLRDWRGNCFCVMMTVLLLLLCLFLASCLLLVLPVVSVSVRTAGGLPAF